MEDIVILFFLIATLAFSFACVYIILWAVWHALGRCRNRMKEEVV